MRDSLVFDLIHVIGKQFLDGAAIELGELRQLVGTRLRKTSLPLAHGRGLYANRPLQLRAVWGWLREACALS